MEKTKDYNINTRESKGNRSERSLTNQTKQKY